MSKKPMPTIVVKKAPLRVSVSTLSSFLNCRLQCHYKQQGWQPIKSSFAADTGTLFHMLLEFVYSHKIRCLPNKRGEAVRKLIDPYVTKWRKDALAKTSDEKQINDIYLMSTYVKIMVPVYFQYWPDLTHERKFDIIDLEQYFEVPFNGVLLIGYRDGKIKWCKDGSQRILEHKATSSVDPYEFSLWGEIAIQNKFYVLAELLATGNYTTTGVLFNMIRRPALRQKQKETEHQFLQRVKDDVENETESYFFRREIPFTRGDINEFQQTLAMQIDDYIAWQEGRLKTYPNNSTSICISRYRCSYIDVCASRTRIETHPMYRKVEKSGRHSTANPEKAD